MILIMELTIESPGLQINDQLELLIQSKFDDFGKYMTVLQNVW